MLMLVRSSKVRSRSILPTSRAQRRLRQLRDREQVVLDAVGGALRVEDLEVEHAVDADLHVVAGDADLRRNVEGRFLERVLVADDVDERQQDVEAGVERAGVAAEALDHERALLRDDDGRLGDHDERHDREQHDDDESAFHGGHPLLSVLGDHAELQSGHPDDAAALVGGRRRRRLRCALPRSSRAASPGRPRRARSRRAASRSGRPASPPAAAPPSPRRAPGSCRGRAAASAPRPR